MLVFDVQGNVSQESEYATVYRQDDMLVVVFVNNLILPFRIKSRCFGRYDLYILDTKVLCVNGRNPLTLIFEDAERRTVQYNIYYGKDYIGGRVVGDCHIVLGKQVLLESKVYAWAETHGVVPPVGCTYTMDDAVIERDCSIVKSHSGWVVTLSNGFRFPMFREGDNLRVVGTVVELEFINYIMIAVRVRESSEICEVFDITVCDGRNFIVLQDLVYDTQGLHYDGNSVSARQITKQLVLGGLNER